MWSSEPPEGLATCSTKVAPSFLSYFKTLIIGLAQLGIEPATSRFAVTRFTDWANTVTVVVTLLPLPCILAVHQVFKSWNVMIVSVLQRIYYWFYTFLNRLQSPRKVVSKTPLMNSELESCLWLTWQDQREQRKLRFANDFQGCNQDFSKGGSQQGHHPGMADYIWFIPLLSLMYQRAQSYYRGMKAHIN